MSTSGDRIVRNLHQEPTIVVIDDSLHSRDYFNILEMPSFFKLGANTVRINPNIDGLQYGSAVEFEFVSSDGTILATEVLNDPDNAGASIIQVFVEESTPPEGIIIRLLGTAKFGTILAIRKIKEKGP